jgi:hypothetical protein
VARDEIFGPREDDAPRPGRLHEQLIAGPEASATKRLDGDRGLVLGAEAGAPALPHDLYFLHRK